MCKLCVFAGTTEGRELTEFLCDQGARVTACVATEYGQTLLMPRENLTISAKRLTAREMEELFAREKFDLVVDATHPYASAVTENIAAACESTGVPYQRLSRRGAEQAEDGVFVPDIAGAVEYLNGTDEPILLTTGSKELAKYVGIRNFSERVYARVLPMEDSGTLPCGGSEACSHSCHAGTLYPGNEYGDAEKPGREVPGYQGFRHCRRF